MTTPAADRIPEDSGQGVFRGPKTLSVMPTYTCTAECRDCGTVSSPRDRTNLPLKTILQGIDEAREQDFLNVVFTGGEATLRWKDLLVAIAHAKSLEFPTRLVTNAYWATSPEKARAKIDALIEAGLDEINYSTGDEHTRFVPLDRVVEAAVAAVERGLRCHVMIEMRAERRVTEESFLEHPRITELPDEQRKLVSATESPWMPLDPHQSERYPDGTTVNAENVVARHGCDSVLQTYVLEADGRVGACCGLGMRIIPELNVTRSNRPGFLAEATEEAESDFLKLWLRYKGPEKILAWAAEKDPSIEWEDRYAHRCQACLRIYKDPQLARVIREHHGEVMSDVLQSAWFDEEFIPGQMEAGVRPFRRYSREAAEVAETRSA